MSQSIVDIRNPILRRSIIVGLTPFLLAFAIIVGALNGAIDWVSDMCGAIYSAWQGRH